MVMRVTILMSTNPMGVFLFDLEDNNIVGIICELGSSSVLEIFGICEQNEMNNFSWSIESRHFSCGSRLNLGSKINWWWNLEF